MFKIRKWNSKKVSFLLKTTTKYKINFINLYKNKYSIKVLCKILNVNLANYYKQRFNNKNDFKEINSIKKFLKKKKCYGYRRLKIAIEKEVRWIINHKKLLKLIKNYNIRANWVKYIHRKNTDRSYENLLDAKYNLLQRNFRAEKINQKWVTDITYIKIYKQKYFLYLSTIIDLYDKRIIAYEISFKNNTELVMNTLLKAVKNKKLNGLILHSDQGIQYRTTKYNKFCENLGIRISMSRKGTPLDNAVIESFHSILKKETIYQNKTRYD
ncbi:IS3 family transposase [Spiroplasma endosymbiont of Polydrusus cervinus]|uniref:IS3 family transposase n=1 Tax=Spiroplasma endosymbiont of Polydrusus cervinus TaxID=3066287 RepID=UPI0030D39851